MKTKTKKQKLAAVKGTGIAKVPREVAEYKREAKKLRAAFQRVSKLQESKAVQAYEKSKEVAARPVQTEQEQRQSELIHLYDEYSRDLTKAQNKLYILSELSFGRHDCDITLDQLHGTIIEIEEHVRVVEERAKRAFELLGIGQAESEPKDEKAA